MFLEELSLAVHVGAVEDAVAVDLLVLESRCLLSRQIRIRLVPHIVLMSLQVVFLWFLLLVEFILVLSVALVEGALEFAETIGEVAEDVGAADLHERLISRLQKDHELLVHVPKHMIAQYLIHPLPVLSDHALLVEVDVVALDGGGALSK